MRVDAAVAQRIRDASGPVLLHGGNLPRSGVARPLDMGEADEQPARSARTVRRCRSPKISIRLVSSVRAVSTKLSGKQFALRQRGRCGRSRWVAFCYEIPIPGKFVDGSTWQDIGV